MRPTTRTATAPGTAARTAAALVLSGALLVGCSAAADVPETVDEASAQAEEGMADVEDDADGMVQSLQDALDGSTLDEDAKAELDDAVASASAAIADARTAIDEGADADAVEAARTGLGTAGEQLEAAAADAEGPIAATIAAVQEQMTNLGNELDALG